MRLFLLKKSECWPNCRSNSCCSLNFRLWMGWASLQTLPHFLCVHVWYMTQPACRIRASPNRSSRNMSLCASCFCPPVSKPLCRYLLFNLNSPSALVPLEHESLLFILPYSLCSLRDYWEELLRSNSALFLFLRVSILSESVRPIGGASALWSRSVRVFRISEVWGVLSASNPSLNSRPGHFLWRAWSAIGNPETSQKGRECSRNVHACCKIVKWEQISDGRYSHKL